MRIICFCVCALRIYVVYYAIMFPNIFQLSWCNTQRLFIKNSGEESSRKVQPEALLPGMPEGAGPQARQMLSSAPQDFVVFF